MKHDVPLPELPRTGHRDIDMVHRRLGENLAALSAALDAGDRDQAMTGTVALLDCLRADYACEESLMHAAAYPDTAAHLQSHAHQEAAFTALARRLRSAAPDFGPGERAALRIELSRIAVELASHVLKADIALVRFLDAVPGRERGG
jgi:hemerythrin